MMRLRHCQLCRSLQLSVLFDLVWVCLVFLSPLGSFCFCVCEVAADSRVVAALQLCYVAMSIKGTNPALKKPSNIPEIYAKMFGRFH